jgi:hypothetical protein
MNVRRKSLHRRANCKHAKKRANQRAAKERRRISRALAPVDYTAEIAEAARCPMPAPALRFRITVECLADGERSQFITAEGPHGWTVSPTLIGQRVAKVVQFYRPAP